MLVVVPAQGCSDSVAASATSLWAVELLALVTLSISTGRPLPMVVSTQYPLMMALSATATLIRGPLSSAMSIASPIMISGLFFTHNNIIIVHNNYIVCTLTNL